MTQTATTEELAKEIQLAPNNTNSTRIFRKGIIVSSVYSAVRREFEERFPKITLSGRRNASKLDLIGGQESHDLLLCLPRKDDGVVHPKAVRHVLRHVLYPPLPSARRGFHVPVEDVRFVSGETGEDPSELSIIVGDPDGVLAAERESYMDRLVTAVNQDSFSWSSNGPFKFIIAQADPAFVCPEACEVVEKVIGDEVFLSEVYSRPSYAVGGQS